MDLERFIGSIGVRVATLVFLSLVVMTVVLHDNAVSCGQDALFAFIIIAGIIVFVFLFHCSRALYTWWVRFAELFRKLVVMALFGGCYLLIVPWFFLAARAMDARRWLGRSEPASFWIRRRREEIDGRSLTRMG